MVVGLIAVGGLVGLVVGAWPAVVDEGGPDVVFVAAFTVLWAVVAIVNVAQMRRWVRGLRVDADGVVLDRVLGDDVAIRADDLATLDRARLFPQPGWLRLRDTHDRTWNIVPVDDEFALTDLLRAMVDD